MIRKLLSLLALAWVCVALPAIAQSDPVARGLAAQALTTRMWKNLSDFGVKYGVNSDQSAAVNAAFASGYAINCTGTVYVNNTLYLQNGMTLQGNGAPDTPPATSFRPGCVFQAMSGMTADMVNLAVGLSEFTVIRDVSFNGVSTNSGQNGLKLASQYSASVTGGQAGLWYALFENISINKFDGVSLALMGGCSTSTNPAPIQFVSFKNVFVQRPNSTSGAALYATGQVEHVHIDSSKFDSGASTVGGTNVYLGRPWGTACTTIGSYGTGTVYSSTAEAPIDWTFTNSTTQGGNQAIMLDDVGDVTFSGHWAEQDNNFLYVENNSRVSVMNAHLANAALTGYLVYEANCSEVEWINTHPIGATSNGFYQSGCGSVHFSGNLGNQTMSNITWTTGTSGTNNDIQTYTLPGLYLSCSTSGTSISGFNSDLAPGEMFFVKIASTSAYSCTLNSTGATSNYHAIRAFFDQSGS